MRRILLGTAAGLLAALVGLAPAPDRYFVTDTGWVEMVSPSTFS